MTRNETLPGPRRQSPGHTGPPNTACYLHTPFCAIKCAYCNFFSGVREEGQGGLYFDALAAEIRHHAGRGRLAGRVFDTLYLGGGTPTALEARELEQLFSLLRSAMTFDPEAEITSEANPESLTPAKAHLLRELGVNRISLGAQSFHDDELAALNRPHDAAAIGTAVRAARAAGFENLSLDLIYGLPGQTLGKWQETVEAALQLEPDHLSCYCLIIESGTPLARDVREGRTRKPDEDLQRDMFDWLVERLDRAGLAMYEISNFARPGKRSEHNLRYWTGRPWLGLGPSAHSYLDGDRAANPADLIKYARQYDPLTATDPFHPVERADLVFERVFMALRLTDGLDLAAFEREFGASLESFYPGTVERLTAAGLVIRDAGRLRVAPHAWFVSDGIFSEFAP
jgi:oxygen-independent coproporphyrinogen-3 oxidase